MKEKKIRPFNLNSGGECNRWGCPSFDRDSEQNCYHSETSKVCIHSKEYKRGAVKMNKEKLKTCPFCEAKPLYSSFMGWAVEHKTGCYFLEHGAYPVQKIENIEVWEKRCNVKR